MIDGIFSQDIFKNKDLLLESLSLLFINYYYERSDSLDSYDSYDSHDTLSVSSSHFK